jgi:3-oxoacyl-[acyl-carrier protein] reductase
MKRKVIVTGSSRGIGRAIVLALARGGFDPVVHCASRVEAAAAVADELKAFGGSGEVLRFDVSRRDEARGALEAWVAANGAPYGVVLNAGVADDSAFPAMEDEQWDRVLRTDLDGFYNVLRPLVLPMVQARRGGRIVALSSVSGVMGNRGQVNYSAAKAGIVGAAKALAVELARRSITVNCVAPGVIETEMTADIPAEEISKAIPMRRFGSADEVAAVVSFLMSDAASYVTRQVIGVNGGMC